MPRVARKQSESGIYHVMLRGINRQQIFEDSEDYNKFLQILKECKAISEFDLFAYCLMGNHIHLMIKPNEESLEQIFKRIAGRFVYWYNLKYQRCGHLFQDRFKSEPVEDNSYFLTVLRYIHQNPVKAGLCKAVKDYRYSSYKEYLDNDGIIDRDFVLSIIPPDEFVVFNSKESHDKCLDIEQKSVVGVTEEQAQDIMHKYTKCRSVSEFQSLDIKTRDKRLKLLKEKGLSIRQISRLTGVSYYIVQKI